ncbi:kinase-like domain-containing protein [Rhizophagus irregularis DAOM 181602=DAOM 197198]|uniref:Protein kinase domain-containing protein n=2 Tax=Rhizophagus irregularis TaxID=588596 RepID=A0A015JEI6_RHIIW|nr:kinase-like domain-containing protein [Rhizophagus irregularis DAOM 181602=DAOM 197198]EXX65440.1 hypothetical protein RirG_133220 [Rhizophagus irregularis DAOM 197198w]POG63656.1 kinase-like domain-containing protein [Rhizophagus irregularis DAOM 181602=DAOM 197198]GBC26936.1 kinase-like domain-containing protein [Rhizophagus irregularis DAOM 181602=DAOM 197198]|eukprot:XP_025170522.1 kinase-like domain-containing protein [Rhizophagus irregularis DAOM 181602=DAOM 197198]
MHRDFHSGNILYDLGSRDRWNFNRLFIIEWKIRDLGLSQAVNNRSSNNEIYGVIPYIAPEIFKESKFSQKADIYGNLLRVVNLLLMLNMIFILDVRLLMENDLKLQDDTPECYATLMKSCWDPDPKKRPSIKNIYNTLIMYLAICSQFKI